MDTSTFDDDFDTPREVIISPISSPTSPSKRKSKAPVKNVVGPKKIDFVKKPHRFRPGTVALREIRKMQKSTCTVIPRLCFYRLVKEIAGNCDTCIPSIKFESRAITALQESSEAYLVEILYKANLEAIFNKRQTLYARDIKIVVAHHMK